MPYSAELRNFKRELEPIRPSQIQFRFLTPEEIEETSKDRKIHCFLRPNGEIQKHSGDTRCKDRPLVLAFYGENKRYCCDDERCRRAAAKSISDGINFAVDKELSGV